MDAHEREVPPPGGFGGGPSSRDFGPGESHGEPRRRFAPLVTIGVMAITIASILVLVITGCHRYIATAKTAEARHSLNEISTQAAMVYEEHHRVCPSASKPVPPDPHDIAGRAYQTGVREWQVDAPNDAGFACLRYEMPQPQYFQYSYFATPTSFLARARGDLNGDGVMSDFIWTGDVKGDHLVIAPRVYERDIEE